MLLSIQAVAATPVKVESWLASAASSLKKSLPPQSGKKTAPNSARKMKIPTPRQSRLGSSTPLKSAPSCVNLFQETSNVEIIVPAVIESVTSAVEENNEVIGEILKNEEMEVLKNEEMEVVKNGEIEVAVKNEEIEVAVKEEVQVVIESISIALEMEIVKAETEIFINIPEVVLESSVEFKSVEVETNIIPSDIDTPQETMILATVETVKTPIKEVCLQEIKMITPGRSTRSKVAAVFSAVKSLTPARVTRSRIPTPAPKVLEPVESVVRTTRSRSTPCKKVNDIPAVAPVEESSAVTDIVPVVAVIANEIDVCIPTPSRRNTLKRSNSILATLSADVIIAKRSRKGEKIEDKFQADVIVPDMIVFPSEEVPDMIVFNDIVATDIAVSVPEVAEVKKRGRPARLVKAVEVEVKEDEEEVALALLCDG